MSYQRMDWPLEYFKGNTKSYVFLSTPIKKGDPNFVEDYNDEYKDNASFCELIGIFVERATKDEKYAEKIIRILAKKLRVTHKLRKKKLTEEQYSKEMDKQMKKFRKDKFYKSIFGSEK